MGGYNQISSSANAPDDGFGPVPGGLGSSMAGNEFGLEQGPVNVDRQAPLTDEVPF